VNNKPTKDLADTVSTAVRLQRDIYDQLRQSDLGITESIKRGLALLFARDLVDPKTRELADLVVTFASRIERLVMRGTVMRVQTEPCSLH
jgi:nitrogen-specific signal transduction histidine kinase